MIKTISERIELETKLNIKNMLMTNESCVNYRDKLKDFKELKEKSSRSKNKNFMKKSEEPLKKEINIIHMICHGL